MEELVTNELEMQKKKR